MAPFTNYQTMIEEDERLRYRETCFFRNSCPTVALSETLTAMTEARNGIVRSSESAELIPRFALYDVYQIIL